MKTKVKIEVSPQQSREIQKIVFKNRGSWSSESFGKTKTSNILYVLNGPKLSWETNILAYSKDYKGVDADDYIREHTEFPVYKKSPEDGYIVEFTDLSSGLVVWSIVTETIYKVDHFSTYWRPFYESCWKDISEEEINRIKSNKSQHITSEETDDEIPEGTIVLATRKSTSEKHQDYIWQGKYFGYCNGKHLIDENTTHVQLADTVELIPTLTKHQAKQKISELFANPKNVTPEKVRNIIDLIKI